ncbi:MAG: U5 small nuclear ribonucleoprotein component [Marteilia pararefringens]
MTDRRFSHNSSEPNDDDGLYDEFGNYLGESDESGSAGGGGENDESEDSEAHHLDHAVHLKDGESEASAMHNKDDEYRLSAIDAVKTVDHDEVEHIVQFEDRKLYESANEIFGDNVDVIFENEDEMAIEEPLVAPKKSIRYSYFEKDLPETTYDMRYLAEIMDVPTLIRNVSLVGNIHSGKTSLVDCLIRQTHLQYQKHYSEKGALLYTDTLVIEKHRGVSIQCSPVTLLLPASTEKNYLFNIFDNPGHVNFSNELSHSNEISDGIIIVLDVCEGIPYYTEQLIIQAVNNGKSIILCLNKIDRFILELKIAPTDCFGRLRTLIDEINLIISKSLPKHIQNSNAFRLEEFLLHPAKGNVLFASTLYGFCFSLSHFSKLYCEKFSSKVKQINSLKFAQMLWGDIYYDPLTKKFKNTQYTQNEGNLQPTFVNFVLNPIYKIFVATLSYEPTSSKIQDLLKNLNISLVRSETKQPNKQFIRTIFEKFFRHFSWGLVDSCVQHVPSPVMSAKRYIESNFKCHTDSSLLESAKACSTDEASPLLVNIVKIYPSPDGSSFNAFGRVYSGVLRAGQDVVIMGPEFTNEDQEDSKLSNIGKLWINMSRYQVQISSVPAGNWVLIEGIDGPITKQATITDTESLKRGDAGIFKKIKSFAANNVLKVSIEPTNPSELPKMLDGLRKLSKTYIGVDVKVEESGEHVIQGTGELHLDSMLHDLRTMFTSIDIKVSDPFVSLCETVVETSALKCFAQTPNRLNKLTMIAEPLDRGLGEDIESGQVPLHQWSQDDCIQFFTQKYNWDILAARSIWSFGPESECGPNVLLDDTLPSDIGKDQLLGIRDSVVLGFQWAAREGPLCDEPMRNVKFKILNATLADNPSQSSPSQIIPTARRVAYSSFLMATPRMIEPYYLCECVGPADCVSGIYAVLSSRRGHIISDQPIACSPLFSVRAYVPAIDSFGLETDLRIHTQGQAFCTSSFHHWQIAPGDPLDKSIVLEILKPQQPIFLAREFMLKTRRRKGLNEDVSVNKFFDDPMLLELAKQDIIFSNAL